MMSAGESPVSGPVGNKPGACAEMVVLSERGNQIAAKIVCSADSSDPVINQSEAIVGAYKAAWKFEERFAESPTGQSSTTRVSLMTQERAIAYLQAEQARIKAQAEAAAKASQAMAEYRAVRHPEK